MSNSTGQNMTAREIAADIARELRESPERWVARTGIPGWASAINKAGEGVPPESTDACAWTLYGHVIRRNPFALRDDPRHWGWGEIGPKFSFAEWEEKCGRDVETVIAFCDRIASAPAGGGAAAICQ